MMVGFSVWKVTKGLCLKHTEAFILDRTTATRVKATICNNLHLNLCLLVKLQSVCECVYCSGQLLKLLTCAFLPFNHMSNLEICVIT